MATETSDELEMLRVLTVDDMGDDNPGGTGLEANFRNFMLREIAFQLCRIADALETK